VSAIEAGIKHLVVLTEHIPAQDVMAMHAAAARHGTRIVGPNTAGLVTPGECFIGIMPAFVPSVFKPGHIGVISRSGSLGTLICLELTRSGLGQSAFIGIGGDPMLGTTTRDALAALDHDPPTEAVVIVGEIGGTMEEDAADYARTMRKPVAAFIAGAASPPGKKMGHAGAIVTGNRGGYASKRRALEAAGVIVADTPAEFADAIVRLYHDRELWEKLAAGGRDNIRRYFSRDVARSPITRLIALADGHRAVRLAAGEKRPARKSLNAD